MSGVVSWKWILSVRRFTTSRIASICKDYGSSNLVFFKMYFCYFKGEFSLLRIIFTSGKKFQHCPRRSFRACPNLASRSFASLCSYACSERKRCGGCLSKGIRFIVEKARRLWSESFLLYLVMPFYSLSSLPRKKAGHGLTASGNSILQSE